MASEFDFNSYLTSVDPQNSYTITPLSHSKTNQTVRANITPKENPEDQVSADKTSPFTNHESIILKHASPNTQARQKIEAHILKLLPTKLREPLLQKHPFIHIPEVLYYSQEEHVLAISDLGESLSSITSGIRKHHDSRTLESWGKIAGYLGAFLAGVHSPAVRELVDDDDEKVFGGGKRQDAEFENAVAPLLQNLKDAGVDDAEELFGRVKDEFYRKSGGGFGGSLQMGDCGGGNVLMFDSPPEGTADEKFMVVVGWDSAGISSKTGLAGDFAQLMPDLVLNATAGEIRGYEWRETAWRVVDGVARGYREGSLENENGWIKENGEGERVADVEEVRGFVLVLGREMVNKTVGEFVWPCECCEGGDSKKGSEKKDSCEVIGNLRDIGIRLLKAAGKDKEVFKQGWNELRKERALMSVFGVREIVWS